MSAGVIDAAGFIEDPSVRLEPLEQREALLSGGQGVIERVTEQEGGDGVADVGDTRGVVLR
jgi:hypothetical protein